MSSSDLIEQNLPSLTKYPTASVRELFRLSVPLIFVLLSGCLMNFCDRLFLAHSSFEAFEGCVSAAYLCTLFQVPCARISSMTQIFVGFHKGAKNSLLIGECVWQMIWFSLLSMVITFPLSRFAGPFFLGGTSIETPALTYFQCLMFVNFLFPLGAALASFYIAEGKTKALFLATISAQIINVALDYLLIFGVEGVLPPQGILGAAIATGIAQGSFCTVLFIIFLQKRHREKYGTDKYSFRWKPFWHYVQVGIPRAISRIIILTAWAATVRLVTLKSGDFLVVLSVGGTLFLLFAFINEGMAQAIMTIASRLIGAREYITIQKLRRSAFALLALFMSVLTIPFLLFPQLLLSFFFTDTPSPETLALLQRSCLWIWVLLLCNGINAIGFSLISAACNTVFHMMASCLVWLTSYLPVYLAFQLGNWSPDLFWLIIAFDALATGLVFHWKASKNNMEHTSFEKCHLNLLL
ncbi:MAG: polysaccharide biosynthesis C-terminal domain-containing protein [Chlamydiales bacterium]|nr:polysaccharide biosynthesis C-terminal domain-containing protein [Chlamydiales bacterium]